MSVRTVYIEPGSPWESGYVESFNGNLGVALLSIAVFDGLLEARVLSSGAGGTAMGTSTHAPPRPPRRAAKPRIDFAYALD